MTAKLLLGAAGAFALTASMALAQADPPAPEAPASIKPAEGPLMGRPETPGAQSLAPEAPPPLTTAESDLPLDKIKLPEGFTIEVFASGVKNARTLRVAEGGTVIIGNWQANKVWAAPPGGAPKVIYEDLDWPNGIAIHDGDLYIAEHTRIVVAEDIEANLDSPPELREIYSDLGEPRPHGWRFLAVGPDEHLYVSNSAPCNICEIDEGFGEIRKVSLDGATAEPVLRGMRNTVGFDFHPETGDLYFTDNQRDWLSEDLPEDELNRMTEPGAQHFGFPFCHNGTFTDPEFGWGYSCGDFEDPVALLGPHTAPLGMRFYTGDMFPEEYRGQIFIARHGPWNRTTKIAADIVVAHLDGEGGVERVEPFLTGLIEDNAYIGRPVDVEVMADGSLLVSDDWNGAVYRIAYGQ